MRVKKNATLRDVANMAGVSVGTVSKFLHYPQRVKPLNRKAIQKAIRQLEYTPNLLARQLAVKRSYSILLYILAEKSIHSSTWMHLLPLVQVLNESLQKEGYSLQIKLEAVENIKAASVYLDQVCGSHSIDGLILLSAWGLPGFVLRPLVEKGFPFVIIDSHTGQLNHSQFYFNNFQVVKDMVSHLASLNHKRIGFLHVQNGQQHMEDRFAGYRQGLTEHNLAFDETLVCHGNFTVASGDVGARRLLAWQQPPTALICGNDDMAVGAVQAAAALGIAIPANFSVMGIDNSVVNTALQPTLTTAQAPMDEPAQAALHGILQKIENPAARPLNTVLPYKFIQGETIAPAPNTAPNTKEEPYAPIVVEKNVTLKLVEEPIPVVPEEVPAYTAADYQQRIDALWQLAEKQGYTHIVVYGDREHYNNMCYLCGLDPRFEEALLVLQPGQKPVLVLGNECMGYAGMLPLDVETVLFQDFSLMGQPRGQSQSLRSILAGCGIAATSKIGVVGWKEYDASNYGLSGPLLDIPAYLAALLADMAGAGNLYNAIDLLAHNEYGLKHNLSAKEVVHFELNGTRASRQVWKAIKGLRPGITEIEASALLARDGEPDAIHPNINFDDANASYGLRSPTYHQTLKVGDIAGIGVGYRGSLVHKQGFFVQDAGEMHPSRTDAIETFVKPYFAAVAHWYEAVAIGANFGALYDAVDNSIGIRNFGIGLNPGHLIHMDEWTNSPIIKGGSVKIHSGMALQCDFTAQQVNPFRSVHVEDGLVVADEALRREIATLSPSCWQRIAARQNFMRHTLNINLHDEVLPLSDLCAVCLPYMANPSVILAVGN